MYKLIVKNSKNPFMKILYIEHKRKIIDYIDLSVPSLLNTYSENITKKTRNRKLDLEKVTNRDIYTGKIEEYIEFTENNNVDIEVNIENDPSILLNDSVKVLYSIEEAREYLQQLIPIAQSLLGIAHMFCYMGCLENENAHYEDQMSIYEINKDDFDMLVNQLIFDLLYDYYDDHSERITRYGFAKRILKKVYEPKGLGVNYSNTLDHRIRNIMKKRYSSFDSKITLNRIGMTDFHAQEYDNPNINLGKTNSAVSNQPSTFKSNIKLKKRTFASWIVYFFNNCIIPKKYTNTDYIITNDEEFQRFISDLNEYREIVQAIIPPGGLASNKLYFYQTIEYYETERITGIDTLINIYLSISENIQSNNPYRSDILKELSGWRYQYSTPVSILFMDDDNTSLLASTDLKLFPMPLIEEKHLKKVLEKIKSKDSWSEINDELTKCKNYIKTLHLIRYKSLELFRHYASFQPDVNNGFSSFKDFIWNNYRLADYSNDIWNRARRKK